MARALNRQEEKAARIVAAYCACKFTPPQDDSLSTAFRQFLEECVPAMALGQRGLHVRLEPQKVALGRPLHLYSIHHRGNVYSTLVMNDVQEKDGTPRGPKELRAMALAGESRFFADRLIWLNPYWEGRIRTEILWWGAEPLWSQCGEARAGAARLAWEALAETEPWRWKFEISRTDSHNTELGGPKRGSDFEPGQRETLSAIRRRAETLLPAMIVGAFSIPIRIFQERGRASILDALAYHLIADPNGRRLPWKTAARLLGYYHVTNGEIRNDWRVLYSAVRAYRRVHPDASPPPRGRNRAAEYRILPGQL